LESNFLLRAFVHILLRWCLRNISAPVGSILLHLIRLLRTVLPPTVHLLQLTYHYAYHPKGAMQ
jgi:hypothetical protein